MDLRDKTIVVTGATAGLGLAFSRALVSKGATVFGLARRTQKLDAITAELGTAFRGVQCDVSSESDVTRAFTTILEQTNRLDVLVNNAGLGRFGKVEDMSMDDWDAQVDTNLKGVFLCSQRVLPTMKAQNKHSGFGGHIVNICSVSGLVGSAATSIYNATKFGLRGFSEAMMKEVREDGIKVTCLMPGSIQTDFFDTAGVGIIDNPMTAQEITSTLLHVLETPDNYLISEITMRPLRPRS